VRLTGSTSAQAIRERLGVGEAETLRESEKRRRYLQTYARLLATDRPTVRFSETLRTAVTEYDGDRPTIAVTTRAFDQPVTDLRRRVFDLAVQEALVVHEMGHLLYTDVDGFHDLLADVDPDRRRLFARIWNTLEDGAVERQLRHRYAVATELDLLNANLLETGTFGHESHDGRRRFSFFHAVVCGLADMAIYDSGRFRRLGDDDAALRMASLRDRRVLEEFIPVMRRTVRRVLSEPEPAARNRHVWSFWTALRDALDDATASGAGASELARLLDADGTVRTDGRPDRAARATDADVLPDPGAGAPVEGKPDDTAGEFGRETRSARELPRETVAREVTRQVTRVADPGDHVGDDPSETHRERPDAEGDTAGDDPGDEWAEASPYPGAGRLPGESGADADAEGEPAGSGLGSADGADETPRPPDDRTQAAIRERYREELAAEATELDRAEARLAELDGFVDALERADLDGASLRVVTDGDGHAADRWRTVRRDAGRLARRFRSRLREQRRDVEWSRRRRGEFDRSRLVAAARGRPDVFARTEAGDERQYSCIVVLDRSGSMGDGAVTAAETGALTAVAALESVGVAVTLLDVHGSEVRLVKTGAETAREARERVLTGQAGGGTPLSTALALVRTRLRDVENPFAVVVTDGRPDDAAAYTAELDAVTFPVLGVYLASPDPDGRPVDADRSYFHQLAVVEEWSSLGRRLEHLAGRVLF